MNHDETTARQSAAESIANEVDAARAERDDYQRRYRNQMIAARDLVDKLAAAEAERDALKAALERAREWAASDVVTARTPFGDGYREAMRDMRDILKTAAKEKGSSSPGGAP